MNERELEKLAQDVADLKYAMFGIGGQNGLRSEVRGLREELRNHQEGMRTRRREELHDSEERAQEERRNRWTAISVTVMGVGVAITTTLQLIQTF